MTSNLPAWTALDGGALPLPSGAPGGPGRVVALLATRGAAGAGWAGACAVGLARAWASAGHRVVLADLNLSAPGLHDEVGLANAEGLSDVLLWGASVRRVAKGIGSEGFYLVSAGTAVADPASALASPRWGPLCDGFRDAGVTLAVFLHDDAPAREAVVARASEVVIVAPEEEDLGAVADALSLPVVGVVGMRPGTEAAEAPDVPEAPETPEAAEVTDVPEVTEVAEEEVVAEEPTFTEPAAWSPEDLAPAEEPAPDAGEPEAEEAVSGWGSMDVFDTGLVPEAEGPAEPEASEMLEAPAEPGVPEEPEAARPDELPAEPEESAPDDIVDPLAHVEPLPAFTPQGEDEEDEIAPRVPPLEEVLEDAGASMERPAGRRRTLLAVLVLLVVVLAVVVASLLGYVHIPGVPSLLGEPVTSTEAAPLPQPTGAAVATPTEVTPPALFEVALGAYRDGAVASGRVSRLSAQVPGVVFLSVPVDVGGVVWYRVLAGPAADSAGASALAGKIAGATGSSPSSWVIRSTPRAFLMDETGQRAAADARAEELQGQDVPAYVLAVDYNDGSTRYRVYAGAFADENEASSLSALLAKRGLAGATLSDRIGRLPE